MVVFCFGPICVPAHLILAALLGFLHSYGYLTWIKTEWVTYRYWIGRWRNWRAGTPAPVPANSPPAPNTEAQSKTGAQSKSVGQNGASNNAGAANSKQHLTAAAAVQPDSTQQGPGQVELTNKGCKKRPVAGKVSAP